MADEKERENFTDAQIKLLISIRLKYEKEFTSGKKSRSFLWRKVLSEMKEQIPDFKFTKSQIHRKFLNIMITYKRIKNRNKNTGRDATSWQHFDQLDEEYGLNYSIERPLKQFKSSVKLPDSYMNQEPMIPPKIELVEGDLIYDSNLENQTLELLKEDVRKDEERHEEKMVLECHKLEAERDLIKEIRNVKDVLQEMATKKDERHQEKMELKRQKLEAERDHIKEMRDLKDVLLKMIKSTHPN